MRDRIHALFMSRQQTVYLFTLMLNCVIYGMLMPTFLMLDIGLGSRVYSIQLIVNYPPPKGGELLVLPS